MALTLMAAYGPVPKMLWSACVGVGVQTWTNLLLGVHPLTLPHGHVLCALGGAAFGYAVHEYQMEKRVQFEARLERARRRKRRILANEERRRTQVGGNGLDAVVSAVS